MMFQLLDGRMVKLGTERKRPASKPEILTAVREAFREALTPSETPEAPKPEPAYPRRVHTVGKDEETTFKGVVLQGQKIHQKHPAEPAPAGIFTGCLGDIKRSAVDPLVAGLHDVLPKPGQRLKAEPAPRASFAGSIFPKTLAGTNNLLACGEFRPRAGRSKSERFTAKSESVPSDRLSDRDNRAKMSQEARDDYERRTGRKLRSKAEIHEESSKLRFVPDRLY